MIPFATPTDNEVINLLTITRMLTFADGSLQLEFTNNKIRKYEGRAAEIIHAEIAFSINNYRQFQIATQQAASGIVVPTDGRIM